MEVCVRVGTLLCVFKLGLAMVKLDIACKTWPAD